MGGQWGVNRPGIRLLSEPYSKSSMTLMCKLSMVKKCFVLKTTKVCERSPEISQHFRVFYCTTSLYIYTRYLDVAMRYLDVT